MIEAYQCTSCKEYGIGTPPNYQGFVIKKEGAAMRFYVYSKGALCKKCVLYFARLFCDELKEELKNNGPA